MIRDFSKEELAPAATDTELTLGAGAFLAMGGGLLLLCAICFALGYSVGHRSSADQSALTGLPSPDTRAAATPTTPGTKPGATQVSLTQAQASADRSDDGTPAAQNQPGSPRSGSSPVDISSSLGAEVHPALAPEGRSQVQGWMVQIAAVSHPEDAQVLVDALRKRGYEVSARHDLNDNLFHVQTGPFVNRNDANAMRQKLLNDGYNAIVQ